MSEARRCSENGEAGGLRLATVHTVPISGQTVEDSGGEGLLQ